MAAGAQCAVRTGALTKLWWSADSLAWALHPQLTRYGPITPNSHIMFVSFRGDPNNRGREHTHTPFLSLSLSLTLTHTNTPHTSPILTMKKSQTCLLALHNWNRFLVAWRATVPWLCLYSHCICFSVFCYFPCRR